MSCSAAKALRIVALLYLAATGVPDLSAHPGSSIVVNAQGEVFFVDTGQGVWKIDTQGRLTLIYRVAYHWMALDEGGHFAKSRPLGEFDRGTFERITPDGSIPTLIISSDYPIAIGSDGGLYYVPFNRDGPREIVRRMPNGQRSVFATLPTQPRPKPMLWVNGIAVARDGMLYVADDDAVRKIDRTGKVSTVRDAIHAPGCLNPLADTPQLPYLRGLAAAPDGFIYAAANGCRSVIAIPPEGAIRTLLTAEPPWSPTGIAWHDKEVYVLEYLHPPGDDRREWTPRVRKIAADGMVRTVATVAR